MGNVSPDSAPLDQETGDKDIMDKLVSPMKTVDDTKKDDEAQSSSMMLSWNTHSIQTAVFILAVFVFIFTRNNLSKFGFWVMSLPLFFHCDVIEMLSYKTM